MEQLKIEDNFFKDWKKNYLSKREELAKELTDKRESAIASLKSKTPKVYHGKLYDSVCVHDDETARKHEILHEEKLKNAQKINEFSVRVKKDIKFMTKSFDFRTLIPEPSLKDLKLKKHADN